MYISYRWVCNCNFVVSIIILSIDTSPLAAQRQKNTKRLKEEIFIVRDKNTSTISIYNILIRTYINI